MTAEASNTAGDAEFVVPPTYPVIPILYGALSVVFTGLGHGAAGQTQKAIAFIVFFVVEFIVWILSIMLLLFPCVLPFMIAYHVIVVIDAYNIASRVADGVPVEQGECSINIITKLPLHLLVKSRIFVKKNSEVQTA